MSSGWKEAKDKWLEGTLLSEDLIQWALTAIQDDDEKLISASFKKTNAKQEPTTRKELDESQKDIRKNLKSNITSLENDLDDLSLNSPNSYKLQISIPSNLNYLLNLLQELFYQHVTYQLKLSLFHFDILYLFFYFLLTYHPYMG